MIGTVEKLKEEYAACIRMVNEKEYLLKLQKFDSIATQWKKLMNHPQLAEMETVRAVIEKLTVIANAEAGCKQSNRKYNLMKNDLSHRMQIPMIEARMRVGSNGPPLQFAPLSCIACFGTLETQWSPFSSES